ncbi:N-(5'-phosphoribosyl)anthranilate isomerase [Streptococcus oralis subsp. tigurinus]|nr:N-(5'-phosphoribosyl)anthranilate isomerase [Streptococcus oralis subsp. tigurinus]
MWLKESRSCRLTKVKICGLSTKEAVETAVSAGADYIGFIFAPSKRQVTLEQAAELAKLIPVNVKKVGVFVSPSRAELLKAIDKVGLDLVQVHGQVGDDLFEDLPCASIQAVQVDRNGHVPNSQADYLLFDAPVAGSGQTFDWGQLDTTELAQPFFIAGGLNEDNVARAIQYFSPFAVDVSSGVETNGQKDHEKIRRFIERVKHGISRTK